ncbi:unnamed protein product [Candida verbasci]|uniref:Uncharacterized protein n=1 Tax=Candida verbasci TaxID=1227364 RepID=A0A9W4X8U9_9ASCO|nr:unnamed protein product [Candida verbasci]
MSYNNIHNGYNKEKSINNGSHNSVLISEKTLKSCQQVKNFNYHQGASITSLDFNDSGQYLISSGVDKSIQLYDCFKGVHYKDIQSQKYGCHSARFTHEELNCLYLSTLTDNNSGEDAIRYLSLSNNSYLRYFKGHKSQVSSLELNPIYNSFISSSFDGTVKIWDFKSANPVGNLEVGQNTIIAYDPQGIIFAIGKYPINDESLGVVEFYDLKSYDKEPFLKVEVQALPNQIWNKLEFSNNGKYLLIGTNSYQHYILDAFTGKTIAIIKLPIYSKMYFKYPSTGCCSFTPDSKYLLVGTSNSRIMIFDLNKLKEGQETIVIDKSDIILQSTCGIPKILQFNPKLYSFATSDTTVTLWSPNNQ